MKSPTQEAAEVATKMAEFIVRGNDPSCWETTIQRFRLLINSCPNRRITIMGVMDNVRAAIVKTLIERLRVVNVCISSEARIVTTMILPALEGMMEPVDHRKWRNYFRTLDISKMNLTNRIAEARPIKIMEDRGFKGNSYEATVLKVGRALVSYEDEDILLPLRKEIRRILEYDIRTKFPDLRGKYERDLRSRFFPADDWDGRRQDERAMLKYVSYELNRMVYDRYGHKMVEEWRKERVGTPLRKMLDLTEHYWDVIRAQDMWLRWTYLVNKGKDMDNHRWTMWENMKDVDEDLSMVKKRTLYVPHLLGIEPKRVLRILMMKDFPE